MFGIGFVGLRGREIRFTAVQGLSSRLSKPGSFVEGFRCHRVYSRRR